jgi:hypothetical protein
MALPSRAIEVIFARMLVRYGLAWQRMWQGVPPEDVQADWAHELDGLTRRAIEHALSNLPPDFPPTVSQFKALAARVPVYYEHKQLDSPKADPKRVAEILAGLRSRAKNDGPRFAWAYALQEREKQGDNLTEAERRMWRDALAVAPATLAPTFSMIDNNALPPGMRKRPGSDFETRRETA